MKPIVKSVIGAAGFLPAVNLLLAGWRKQDSLKKQKVEQARQFYSHFVKKGSLVFDVGANIGDLSEIFLGLGARVVAVEPQPYCQKYMDLRFKGLDAFHLERIGLDEQKGVADIFLNDAHTLSSLSEEFIRKVTASGRYGSHQWTKKMSVPVDTLDMLINKFGIPDYCKIDVEGSECRVLKGLHTPIPLISFEFTPEVKENAMLAIDTVTMLGNYRFWWEEKERFLAPDLWFAGDDFKKYLRERAETGVVADIYARLS